MSQPGGIAQPGVVAQPGVAFQQPTYWPVPSGSNAAGAVTLPYSDVPPPSAVSSTASPGNYAGIR